jgi:hypothetical protein
MASMVRMTPDGSAGRVLEVRNGRRGAGSGGFRGSGVGRRDLRGAARGAERGRQKARGGFEVRSVVGDRDAGVWEVRRSEVASVGRSPRKCGTREVRRGGDRAGILEWRCGRDESVRGMRRRGDEMDEVIPDMQSWLGERGRGDSPSSWGHVGMASNVMSVVDR